MELQKLVLLVLMCVGLTLAKAPVVVPDIVDSIPHDPNHFTQGLFFDGDHLIETTGLYGKSALYRKTKGGQVLDSVKLDRQYFGEGSIAVGDDIFYLTWREGKAFIFDKKNFKKKSEFKIPTEGWGLTFWRDNLLLSNGSDQLIQLAMGGYYMTGVVQVKDGNTPVRMLNELELVGDKLYANIWQTDLIAVIELPSGKVLKYLDFSKKVSELRRKYPNMDVLNGIAFDGKDMWITGKNWPRIYKIKSYE